VFDKIGNLIGCQIRKSHRRPPTCGPVPPADLSSRDPNWKALSTDKPAIEAVFRKRESRVSRENGGPLTNS